MLPRLSIGQRNVDVDEYNSRFENKKKKCTMCKTSSFSIFLVVIVISIVLLLTRGTTNVNEVLSQDASIQQDNGQKMSRKDADILKLLLNLKSEINKAQDRIRKDWQISDYPVFERLMDIPFESWQLQKLKFVKLLIESINSTSSAPLSFVVGFSGSSVTAGHDNHFNVAYPQVFYNAMSPAMQLLPNVAFSVRNHAIGNNPCFPYDACMAAHLGDDLDVLTWEQSMNCGRDARPLTVFCRTAHAMPKKPTVMFLLSGSPSWKPKDCDHNPPTAPQKQLVANAPLFQQAMHLNHLKAMTFLRASGVDLLKEYASLAPMGQNVMAVETVRCQGPYSANFSEPSTGSGAAWHPGQLGHKLRGDNLAYVLLTSLHEAADGLQQALFAPTRVSPQQAASDRSHELLARLIGGLQLPVAKKPADAVFATLSARLANTNTPVDMELRVSVVRELLRRHLSELYSRPLPPPTAQMDINETLNPHPQCLTDFQPRQAPGLASRVHGPFSSWARDLAFFDKAAVDKNDRLGLGYLDRKYIYSSGGFIGSGLAIQLTIDNDFGSPLWLCQLQKGFLKYPPTMGDLSVAASVLAWQHWKQRSQPESLKLQALLEAGKGNYSGEVASHPLMRHMEFKPFTDQCYRTVSGLPRGEHLLILVQKTPLLANIAYVVTW
mmetsp:Transcript_379/g.426  ORF Transcript_379/g.426 Transcript_379/m.426 type:complete len:663 (+) Transcript_379:83-2071(+)